MNNIEKSNNNIIKRGYLPNTPEFNVVKQLVPLHYNVNIIFNTLLKKRGYTSRAKKINNANRNKVAMDLEQEYISQNIWKNNTIIDFSIYITYTNHIYITSNNHSENTQKDSDEYRHVPILGGTLYTVSWQNVTLFLLYRCYIFN